MPTIWGFGLLLLAGQVFAQTQFFTIYPGHPSFSPLPRPPTTAAAIEIEYPIAINVRALVLNQSVRASWVVRMPDGSTKTFQVRSFYASEGFIPYGDYDVQPDPNLPNSALTWDWFGTSGRESLTVSVHRGRVSGTLIAADKNYAVAMSQGQIVFRRIEPSLIPLDVVGSPSSSSKKVPLPDVSHAKFSDPIDVLIVHTPAAVTAAGSRAQLNALIAESFNQANTVIFMRWAGMRHCAASKSTSPHCIARTSPCRWNSSGDNCSAARTMGEPW